MRQRTGALAAAPVVLLLLLTACGPGGVPAEPASPSSEQPTEPIVALPDDAVLAVTAVATAGNGAVLDISLIVHAPQPFSADGAADAWAATTAWCAGEIDDTIVSGYGYSFTTVDVTATPREGEWPDDTPLQVFPTAHEDSTITAYGDLWQVDASAEVEPPDSVPHCKQPVVLDGPGAGQIYIGVSGDVDGDADGTPPLGGWVHHYFGLNTTLIGNSVPSEATLSECTSQVTELGAESGAPTPDWVEEFHDQYCVVGESDGVST
jgi:hypothetical protein